MDKNDLIIKALEERIAQMVAMYERQMAEFRADATIRVGRLEAENKVLRERSEPTEKVTIQGEVIADPLEGRDGPG